MKRKKLNQDIHDDFRLKKISVRVVVLVCLKLFQSFNPHSAGIDFRRQILTTKVHPRTVRVKIFLMVVDPSRGYSNESERAN